MMRKFFIFPILFVVTAFYTNAQELNCNVSIDASNIELTSADKTLIQDLKNAMTNFMNNRRWTNDVVNPEERIKCNIYITVTKLPAFGSFEATASIQSSRPVYESSYESTLLNYIDKKFNFEYNPSQPLDFNENNYFSNLTSLLGFYAYVILGMDYDSFSKKGGTIYFEKARNIAQVAQGGQDAWNPSDNTNDRYWLIENINNQQFIPIREGFYAYHRNALDKFTKEPEEGRKAIFEMLKNFKPIMQFNPSSVFIKSFFLAKSAELINIYSGTASADLKKQVVELLRELDPPNGEKYYTRILNN